MNTTPKNQLLGQLSEYVIFAGQQTLDKVGYGRGASAKRLYFETLAIYLAAALENRAVFPLRIVMDWSIEIEVEGLSIEDSVAPLVIAIPVRGNEAVLLEDPAISGLPAQLVFEDLNQLTAPDIQHFPLLPIFGNLSSRAKPFPKNFMRNARHLSDHIGAPFYALVNFGKPKIRTFFPKSREDEEFSFAATTYVSDIAPGAPKEGADEQHDLLQVPERLPAAPAERPGIGDIKLPTTPKDG